MPNDPDILTVAREALADRRHSRNHHRLAQAVIDLSAAQDRARYMLWLRHGCPVSSLYGDDGEMQCGQCLIDFRRMPMEEIQAAFDRRNVTARAALEGKTT